VAGIGDLGLLDAGWFVQAHLRALSMPATTSVMNFGRFQIGTFFFNSSTIH
jgi:hypothetical protein